MTSFGFAQATVTRPDGIVMSKVAAVLRNGVLTLRTPLGLEETHTIIGAMSEGRKGWWLTDDADQRWLVKREPGGCGCGQ